MALMTRVAPNLPRAIIRLPFDNFYLALGQVGLVSLHPVLSFRIRCRLVFQPQSLWTEKHRSVAQLLEPAARTRQLPTSEIKLLLQINCNC